MPGRPITIDETIAKIGSFSRQDAIDLLASSQGVHSWTGGLGHPLEHCEVTYNTWSMRRFQETPNVQLSGLGGGAGDAVVLHPEELARDLRKGQHTLSWTDEHLILAVQDLLLGKGAFMALYNLKQAGIESRLEFKKPTSHTAIALTAGSKQLKGGARIATSSSTSRSETYKAIFDLCAPNRLQLQTMYAAVDNSQDVEIIVKHSTKVMGNWKTTVVFQTKFPAF